MSLVTELKRTVLKSDYDDLKSKKTESLINNIHENLAYHWRAHPWVNYPTSDDTQSWNTTIWVKELGKFISVGFDVALDPAVIPFVQYSVDGLNWTGVLNVPAEGWISLAWSPETQTLVAVSIAGGANSTGIMTSTDGGLTWTSRNAPSREQFSNVIWVADLGLFVMSSISGTNRIHTSPDGITWTGRTAAAQSRWTSLEYSKELGLLVSVASQTGTDRGIQIMVSGDAINWVSATVPEPIQWVSVAWSAELGIFVGVEYDGVNKVMTSSDGFNWNVHPSTLNNVSNNSNWTKVIWVKELNYFLAVAKFTSNASPNDYLIMTSTNGINWVPQKDPVMALRGSWSTVAWSPELFMLVATAQTGTNRSMVVKFVN